MITLRIDLGNKYSAALESAQAFWPSPKQNVVWNKCGMEGISVCQDLILGQDIRNYDFAPLYRTF